MRRDRGSGGRSAFFGLAMLILGGLLFAAGVMVGRQLALDEYAKSKDPLIKIDQRDKEKNTVDGGHLVFHEVLDDKKPEKPAPPKPKPVPVPAAQPAPQLSLQVAAYRERSQAEDLVRKLSEKGYKKTRIVAGEVAGKGTYYRVRLGPFGKERAEKIRGRLEREERLKALLIKEESSP